MTNGGEGSGEDLVSFLAPLTEVARCLSVQCIPGTNCAACLGGTCGNTCLTKNGKDYAITVTCDRQGVGGELHYCNYPSIQPCQFGCENGACKPAPPGQTGGGNMLAEGEEGSISGQGFAPEKRNEFPSAVAFVALVALLIAGYSVMKK